MLPYGAQQGDEAPSQTWEELIEYHWTLPGAALMAAPEVLPEYSCGGYIAMEIAARARSASANQATVMLLDVPHSSVIPAQHATPTRAVLLSSIDASFVLPAIALSIRLSAVSSWASCPSSKSAGMFSTSMSGSTPWFSTTAFPFRSSTALTGMVI
ncbi:thioesterase domain-containing protein [Janthinobacterium sp. S3M3]|uniref:thioesterase domain-containing protein n=1 Tax=Janthinobacterium sp. S3M3 TaxID=2723078 RepID=UPI003907E807